MNKEECEIYEYLKSKQLYCEVIYNDITKEFEIYVDWGDWKHDHGFLDFLMHEKGFVKVGEETTEEDGSDVYSSIHYFKKTLTNTNKLEYDAN